MDFAKRYAKLNIAQKEAVDTIDGPVMVIAGPGTGKTELLSVRVANILQKTDTLPENILCLTFTDSGANTMRERLTEIIGKNAYKVAVHTFHSFGSEIINQNSEYFYQGPDFHAADDLSRYELIQNIFDALPHNNPLSKKVNDEYIYLRESLTAISEIKKSGLVDDELSNILDENDKVIEKTESILAPIFADKISKKIVDPLSKSVERIRSIKTDNGIPGIATLSKIISDSLETAVNEATDLNSTKTITAWKNKWFEKDDKNNFILKSRKRQMKLRALDIIYGQYLTKMAESSLYDFDDMILRVSHAMEIFDDLRFNLQEKYQYIMVDEFQDTNMAQMRILQNLTNNEAHGDTPNILIVGDDDQAIYSFQGADISNILDFQSTYPRAKIVKLTENYRSTSDILDKSRNVILQGEERLENIIKDLSKELNANKKAADTNVYLYEANTTSDERHWVVDDIKSKIKSGQKPSEITVITRFHKEINSLLPYFYHAGIAVNYERQDNALEQTPVIIIEQIARLLINISIGNHDSVNADLPKILAHKMWGFDPIDLWKLSTSAYDSRKRWMDIMIGTPNFVNLYNWLIEVSAKIADTTLEKMLDIIIGRPDKESDKKPTFISPIYNYFFSDKKLAENPDEYLVFLDSLIAIRSKLREYRPDAVPNLQTFIEFINLNRKIGSIISVTQKSSGSANAINLMTAHKSKGMEFDVVYILNAVDSVWGSGARSRPRMINYPENLPLVPAGESDDERLRLFYVSMTRAKNELNISYSLSSDNGKSTLKAAFLSNEKWRPEAIKQTLENKIITEAKELIWYQPLINPVTTKMNDLLLPRLTNYKLSATHLNNFIDIMSGGPSAFLLNNLLHFPQEKTASLSFGTAIHNTLQNTHAHFASTNQRQTIDEITSNFEKILQKQRLSTNDFKVYLQKGLDVLRLFLDKKYDTFTTSQKTELDFTTQHCIVGDAHLTGKLDLIDIDKVAKVITVTDYKTGKPAYKWNGSDEYEKIKLHKYKQQLLFYKLLIENSRDYHGYTVGRGIMQFVEPTVSGEILSLDTEFDREELSHFIKLINAVWTHINTLNLPDTSNYEPSYKGIIAFEQDLIDNVI